jgi:hypothetical protein
LVRLLDLAFRESLWPEFLYTDFTEGTDNHGFFFFVSSVKIRRIRVIRVQDHSNSNRAAFYFLAVAFTGIRAAGFWAIRVLGD